MVEMVLSGNPEAFGPLVLPYRKNLLTLAYRLTQNWEDAKEVAQETFLRAFQYLRTFDRRRNFRNWLLRILVNVSRNHRSRSSELQGVPALPSIDSSGNPDQEYSRRETRSRLITCLEVLTPREKEVFLLRDLEEKSVNETAAILRCSSISVRVHLNSARKKIRNRIRDKYPDLREVAR